VKGAKSFALLAQVATAAGPVNGNPAKAQLFSLSHALCIEKQRCLQIY